MGSVHRLGQVGSSALADKVGGFSADLGQILEATLDTVLVHKGVLPPQSPA
jgi:hypothetical protein